MRNDVREPALRVCTHVIPMCEARSLDSKRTTGAPRWRLGRLLLPSLQTDDRRPSVRNPTSQSLSELSVEQACRREAGGPAVGVWWRHGAHRDLGPTGGRVGDRSPLRNLQGRADQSNRRGRQRACLVVAGGATDRDAALPARSVAQLAEAGRIDRACIGA